MKYKPLFLLLFIFIACDGEEKNVKKIDSFKEIISLRGSDIERINESIFPFTMGLVQDYVFFCDTDNNPHFYLYKLPDFEFIGSFGSQGDSPTDFPDPVFWGQLEIVNESLNVSTYQMNLLKFTTFDAFRAIENNLKEESITKTYMPPEINDAVNIIKLKDGVFIGSGASANGEFFVYNEKTEQFYWKSFIKNLELDMIEEIDKNGLMSEYKLGIIKASPDKRRFVKVYNYLPIINIFDSNGELSLTIKGNNIKAPIVNSKGYFDESNRLYYNNVFLTDDFIYALNLNCNMGQYNNQNMKEVEIDVFNWEGESIKKFKLNEGIGPMSPFVVDEKNRKIYTVNPKSEENYFSQFSYN